MNASKKGQKKGFKIEKVSLFAEAEEQKRALSPLSSVCLSSSSLHVSAEYSLYVFFRLSSKLIEKDQFFYQVMAGYNVLN